MEEIKEKDQIQKKPFQILSIGPQVFWKTVVQQWLMWGWFFREILLHGTICYRKPLYKAIKMCLLSDSGSMLSNYNLYKDVFIMRLPVLINFF